MGKPGKHDEVKNYQKACASDKKTETHAVVCCELDRFRREIEILSSSLLEAAPLPLGEASPDTEALVML